MTVATLSGVPEKPAPPRPKDVAPVALSAVAARVGGQPADDEVSVSGVSMASGFVRPGDLYAGVPGARTHGARFAAAARESGAVALLTDAEGADIAASAGLPTVVVPDPRGALGAAAALVYGDPANALTLVAVTGTQGKTTTTQLIARGLSVAGIRTAVVGTMGTWIRSEPVRSALTTPEAPDLHALFAVMRERQVDLCTLEVSSHALVMHRVDGVVFDLAVFTNFGRDHLDFHHSVEAYFAAKASLFTPDRSRKALVNLDDDHISRLVQQPQVPTRTFSLHSSDADWQASNITATADGSEFDLRGPTGTVHAATQLPGSFNVTNALTALAAVGEAGWDVETAARGIAEVPAVPGRMENVDRGQGFAVVVDYAHKPDAVAAILQALRPVTTGRLVIVLGAGGDRDKGKRHLMGEIAARLADELIVTDDNPRTEDPAFIRSEVIAGAEAAADHRVRSIGDRRSAITTALQEARANDTVLIAGKGHETGQEVGEEVLAFDDRVVAAEVLDTIVAGQRT